MAAAAAAAVAVSPRVCLKVYGGKKVSFILQSGRGCNFFRRGRPLLFSLIDIFTGETQGIFSC